MEADILTRNNCVAEQHKGRKTAVQCGWRVVCEWGPYWNTESETKSRIIFVIVEVELIL